MNNEGETLVCSEFISLSGQLPVVDVRTPAEYRQGHLPGAINIPLFTDEERASVGTIYKKQGREKAILKGLEFVGPKMKTLLLEGIKSSGERKELLVYCWRGGMRSESMAWLFSRTDIKCHRLKGGYKSYRNFILEQIAINRKMIIIGGYTGAGKTSILTILKKKGEQVIDLEAIANHRGSAFGGLGKEPQPTTEHFANLLYHELAECDPGKRIFIEDESRNIGSVFMPDQLYDKIRSARIIVLKPPVAYRVDQLFEEYGKFPKDELVVSVKKIGKRLGGEKLKRAVESIESGEIKEAIEIVLGYYDSTYEYGLGKRDESTIHIAETESANPDLNIKLVIQIANRIWP